MLDPNPSALSPSKAAHVSSVTLMTSRRFAPLFWCQLLSALSDNILKNALGFIILARFSMSESGTLIGLASALFMLPFFLLSALGGDLADCHDKAAVARRLKQAEIGIAILAGIGFITQSIVILFLALIGFGVISALFGPTKYGILPDHMRQEELPLANALIEGSTFIAILTGTAIGAVAGTTATELTHIGLAALVVVLSFACYQASRMIPATKQAALRKPDYQIFRATWLALKDLKGTAALWNCALATTAFWALGAIVITEMPLLVTKRLGGADVLVTLHLAIFAVTLAAGSFLAATLSSGRIVLLPSVLGAGLAAIGLADLSYITAAMAMPDNYQLGFSAYFAQPGTVRMAIDLGVIAFGGGLIVVPTFALLQAQAPNHERARIIAGASILNAAGMVGATLFIAALGALQISLSGLLVTCALAMIGVAIWMARALQISFIRDCFAMMFRIFYRIEVTGLENLDPTVAGPNPIIAVNHVSFLDAAIVLSMLPRQPVFAIDIGIAKAWWLKPFIKHLRAMPLDPANPFATRTLIAAVRKGDPLVIFPEGRLTVTGSLMKVYEGTGLVADKTGAKIVPVRLEGPERTPFSRLSSEQIATKWFPKIKVTVRPPTQVMVDPELVGKSRRQAAGRMLYGIMSDLIYETSMPDYSLFDAVVRAAKLYGSKAIAVEDPVSGKISYGRLLIGARALSGPLMKAPVMPLKGGPLADPTSPDAVQTLGIMLPTSGGAVIAFLAVQSCGRTPAMINFTSGLDAIRSACNVAGIKTIITSSVFIEKAKLQGIIDALSPDITFVMIEALRKKLGKLDLLKASLRRYKPRRKMSAEEPAVVLFTSGSEGMPKGVVLSHRNLIANVTQVAARIDFNRSDKIFNVLPVFHCFGLTGGVVLPLVYGVTTYLYPTPLHYRAIPELVYGTNATVFFGTDTFLTGYAKTANAYDFRSVRFVVAGAEPVKESTRNTYAEKFGLRILEGYGITETSPVLALNTPMYNQSGSVGRFLPDMEIRLEAVDGIADGERLFIKGPNVMMGYLLVDQPRVLQPPADGWHDTGDIVAVDVQGFVTIKGRAKRFAKIGGEMVSLARVDQLAAAAWPEALSGCVALPDPRKGERIICLTTQPDGNRKILGDMARASGLTELTVPAEVVVVPELPLLGSGKVDFPALKILAMELSGTLVA